MELVIILFRIGSITNINVEHVSHVWRTLMEIGYFNSNSVWGILLTLLYVIVVFDTTFMCFLTSEYYKCRLTCIFTCFSHFALYNSSFYLKRLDVRFKWLIEYIFLCNRSVIFMRILFTFLGNISAYKN